jgi:hypothetical protein
MNLLSKTVNLRHGIAKLIAPKLYAETVSIGSLISATPRPMTLFLKDYFKNESLVGAEIGVAEGNNSLSILQELSIQKLFLIDPYVMHMEDGRVAYFEGAKRISKERFSKFPQVTFINKTSDEATTNIDETLDFVYIDGNHSYDYVKRDIANYYPLVKRDGVIGGHDYIPHLFNGVFQAVNEFVQERGRNGFYAVFPDWWLIKP